MNFGHVNNFPDNLNDSFNTLLHIFILWHKRLQLKHNILAKYIVFGKILINELIHWLLNMAAKDQQSSVTHRQKFPFYRPHILIKTNKQRKKDKFPLCFFFFVQRETFRQYKYLSFLSLTTPNIDISHLISWNLWSIKTWVAVYLVICGTSKVSLYRR